jgi:uncharacterized protein
MATVLRETLWVLEFVGKAFLHILPFLALSVPLAVALKRSGVSRKIEAALRGNPVVAILLATVVGAVSPFCSCGVVPVIAALLTGGVPLAPVMAFWIASPSMDPEVFFLSAGALGWQLAAWRLGATLAMSLAGGFITLALERRGMFGGTLLRASGQGRAPAGSPLVSVPAAAGTCSACSCAAPRGLAVFGVDLRSLARDTGSVLVRLAVSMGIAFVLEALIIRWVPQDAVAAALGADTPLAVPLATLIGIPFYTTNLSALGIVSGLMARGMSRAAALSFLVGGAVTTLPAMSAVWGIVRPRVFALYLAFCVGGALLSGLALQAATVLGGWR